LKDKITISDPEKIKAISEPKRIKILEILNRLGEASATRISQEMSASASQVSYHIKILEKHDFIRLSSQETRGNLVEKLYKPVAKDIEVKLDKGKEMNSEKTDDIFPEAPTGTRRELLKTALDFLGDEIEDEDISEDSSLAYSRYYLTEEEKEEIKSLLLAKLEEFADREEKSDEDEYKEYGVGLLLLNFD